MTRINNIKLFFQINDGYSYVSIITFDYKQKSAFILIGDGCEPMHWCSDDRINDVITNLRKKKYTYWNDVSDMYDSLIESNYMEKLYIKDHSAYTREIFKRMGWKYSFYKITNAYLDYLRFENDKSLQDKINSFVEQRRLRKLITNGKPKTKGKI